jgi:hypothetical protein
MASVSGPMRFYFFVEKKKKSYGLDSWLRPILRIAFTSAHTLAVLGFHIIILSVTYVSLLVILGDHLETLIRLLFFLRWPVYIMIRFTILLMLIWRFVTGLGLEYPADSYLGANCMYAKFKLKQITLSFIKRLIFIQNLCDAQFCSFSTNIIY